MRVSLTRVQETADAAMFFTNAWPLYIHEITAFDTHFYALDDRGRWQPDLVGDWTSPVTPSANLRKSRSGTDSGQPFQKSLVISRDEKPVGFVCVGASPFTGYQSHEPGRRILHDLGDTNRELTSLRERLHELGQSVE